jgi:hypothetical protein
VTSRRRRKTITATAGDVMTNGEVNASWGLHLIDVQIAMGNLVEIVRRQAQAYEASRKKTQ